MANLKITLKNLIYPTILYDLIRPLKQTVDLLLWYKRKQQAPLPHLIKQKIVKEYARRFNTNTLIETGTYLGDMIFATRKIFAVIISIEIDSNLFEIAKRRFSRFSHIRILRGDSGNILADVLSKVHEPCLFWLDAHYSSGITSRGDLETPILKELGLILNHFVSGHVVLIDDARDFTGQNSYPSIDDLRNLVREKKSEWVLEVKDDIISMHEKTVV